MKHFNYKAAVKDFLEEHPKNNNIKDFAKWLADEVEEGFDTPDMKYLKRLRMDRYLTN